MSDEFRQAEVGRKRQVSLAVRAMTFANIWATYILFSIEYRPLFRCAQRWRVQER
jgi:hypothetical protein